MVKIIILLAISLLTSCIPIPAQEVITFTTKEEAIKFIKSADSLLGYPNPKWQTKTYCSIDDVQLLGSDIAGTKTVYAVTIVDCLRKKLPAKYSSKKTTDFVLKADKEVIKSEGKDRGMAALVLVNTKARAISFIKSQHLQITESKLPTYSAAYLIAWAKALQNNRKNFKVNKITYQSINGKQTK